MRKFAIVVAASLGLAACEKGDVDLKDASVDDVVKATVNSQTINPGQWSVTNEIVSVDMPGLAGQQQAMKDAMTKAMVGKKDLSENCVTQEQAQQPSAEMFAGKGMQNCKFDKFRIENGALDAVLQCSAGPNAPGAMTMAMQGQYGGDNYDVTTEMKVSGLGGPGGAPMTVKARSKGSRTGACKA